MKIMFDFWEETFLTEADADFEAKRVSAFVRFAKRGRV
jgi:hypothetical protein